MVIINIDDSDCMKFSLYIFRSHVHVIICIVCPQGDGILIQVASRRIEVLMGEEEGHLSGFVITGGIFDKKLGIGIRGTRLQLGIYVKGKRQSHASGDGDEGAKYEALELELPQEPMTRLTVGGETLPMTLVLDAAQGENAPVGEEQPFTASLANWQPPTASEDVHENVLADAAKAAPNTLVLAAVPEANLGSQFTYAWKFNGEVYRLLSNSGVKYVALKVGDDLAAFSTEGFTGGTKYTELKMLGVSTRKFDYTLTMRVNLDPGYVSAMSDSDFSQTCDLSIRAEVENMAYELSGSTNSLMYFYDVYLGPEDMLDQPFGEYKSAG